MSSRHDALLLERVSPGGLTRSGEELTNALKQRQQRGIGREADDQALLSHRRQVAHHRLSLGLGVMDEHIKADHRVVSPLQVLKIRSTECQAAIAKASKFSAARSFIHHGLRKVAGGNGTCSQRSQRQAETANPAAGIAEAAARHISIVL